MPSSVFVAGTGRLKTSIKNRSPRSLRHLLAWLEDVQPASLGLGVQLGQGLAQGQGLILIEAEAEGRSLLGHFCVFVVFSTKPDSSPR
jgi:hypothetical protein